MFQLGHPPKRWLLNIIMSKYMYIYGIYIDGQGPRAGRNETLDGTRCSLARVLLKKCVIKRNHVLTETLSLTILH